MSSTTSGQKGVEAVKNRDYAGAIPLLDKALESSNSPTWLLARAHANQQLITDAAKHSTPELRITSHSKRWWSDGLGL